MLDGGDQGTQRIPTATTAKKQGILVRFAIKALLSGPIYPWLQRAQKAEKGTGFLARTL